jgi:hypothetical protein
MVRPLSLGEEFRDDGRRSNIEFGWSVNSRLTGSGGELISTRVPVFTVDGFTGSVNKLVKIEVSAEGSSKSKSKSKFDRSVGGSSRSRVSLLFGKGVEVNIELSLLNSRDASDGSLFKPRTIWLRNDTGDDGAGDPAV